MSFTKIKNVEQPLGRISTFNKELWPVDPTFRTSRNVPITGRLSASVDRPDDPLLISWTELRQTPHLIFQDRPGEFTFTILPDGSLSEELDLDGLFDYRGTEKLLVVFHGALDRAIYTLPRWEYKRSLREFDGSILFLSDPTLYVHDQLGLGWYIGTERDNGHLMVRELVANAIKVLDPSQIVFMGGSGGGYASLAVSAHFPGSISLVFSPQTSVERYFISHRTRLISSAFPNLEPSESNLETMQDRLDMGVLYSTERANRIYYIQNSGDLSHLEAHCIPFVEAVSRASRTFADEHLKVEYKYLGYGHQAPKPHRLLEYLEKAFLE